uniref:Uncharacterized protein n=1 Tax=Vitrella brassicaformis TaxID=1169539 RepID=A0A7S1PAK6_9ALVE|mmetsp:Transcript_46495/g.115731  ORF Transcript_46495/g.115731 Transcript_46495/m.115731 type:complete len:287 (+) Transcript_46495:171-1031(+)
MVLFHLKGKEAQHEFLYECPASTPTAALIADLVRVHNTRLKVMRLADACLGLAAHGPLRPEETRGLSDEVAKLSELSLDKGATHPDPSNYRTGVPPTAATAEVLKRTAEEAQEAVSHKQVGHRVCMTVSRLQESLDNLRGAVMIAYPAYHNLPEWDPARMILEDKDPLEGTHEGKEVLCESSTGLWWAGKEMRRGKLVSDFLGRNEKTKVVARLQPANAGAPVREPRVDEETHKAMLSFYHKRQQEDKQLEDDEDDSYLGSAWANPRGLKNALVGGGKDIKWKPFN